MLCDSNLNIRNHNNKIIVPKELKLKNIQKVIRKSITPKCQLKWDTFYEKKFNWYDTCKTNALGTLINFYKNDIDHLIFPFFVIYILNRQCYANISLNIRNHNNKIIVPKELKLKNIQKEIRKPITPKCQLKWDTFYEKKFNWKSIW
jgi:late competence protein required for DNA uptake (superfamily II DNA/RNA helicase)